MLIGILVTLLVAAALYIVHLKSSDNGTRIVYVPMPQAAATVSPASHFESPEYLLGRAQNSLNTMEVIRRQLETENRDLNESCAALRRVLAQQAMAAGDNGRVAALVENNALLSRRVTAQNIELARLQLENRQLRGDPCHSN